MCGVQGVSLRSPALKARYASAPFKSNGIPHSPMRVGAPPFTVSDILANLPS